MDVKQVDFCVIKEKIIKTDEILQMYLEGSNKLKKITKAFKELKCKHDRIQLENERFLFSFQSLKNKQEQLEKDYEESNNQKKCFEQKYNQSLIHIKNLEDEIQLTKELKEIAFLPKKSSKKSECNKNVSKTEQELSEYKEKNEFLEKELASVSNENIFLKKELEKLKSEKQDVKCLEKEKMQAIMDLNKLRHEMDIKTKMHNEFCQLKDKEIENFKLRLLNYEKIKENLKDLKLENDRLQKETNSIKLLKLNKADIGVSCSEYDEEFFSLNDILAEMIDYPPLLSPFSPEKSLENDLDNCNNLEITNLTDSINVIKEDVFEKKRIMKKKMIQNKKMLKRKYIGKRKINTRDSLLNALQLLKKSKFNFTISNSSLPYNFINLADKQNNSTIYKNLNCELNKCNPSYMFLNENEDLLGFSNTLMTNQHQSNLNKDLSDNIVDKLANLVVEKIKNTRFKSNLSSENDNFVFLNNSDTFAANALFMKKFKEDYLLGKKIPIESENSSEISLPYCNWPSRTGSSISILEDVPHLKDVEESLLKDEETIQIPKSLKTINLEPKNVANTLISPNSNSCVNNLLNNENITEKIDSFIKNFQSNESFIEISKPSNKALSDSIISELSQIDSPASPITNDSEQIDCPLSPDSKDNDELGIITKIIPLERIVDSDTESNKIINSVARIEKKKRGRHRIINNNNWSFTTSINSIPDTQKSEVMTNTSIKNKITELKTIRKSKRLSSFRSDSSSDEINLKIDEEINTKEGDCNYSLIDQTESNRPIKFRKICDKKDSNDNKSDNKVEIKGKNLPRKKVTKLQSQIMKQIKQKQKMFQKQLKNVNNLNLGCDLSVNKQFNNKNNSKNNDKIIIQNIIIPEDNKESVNISNKLMNEHNSDLKSNLIINQKVNSDKIEKLAGNDVLSQIINDMDKLNPPKENSLIKKKVLIGSINIKEWRKNILDIAEIACDKNNIDIKDIYCNQSYKTCRSGILSARAKIPYKITFLLKKVLEIKDEDQIPENILVEFKRLNIDEIVDIVVYQISKDHLDKPKSKYYLEPLMTKTQRIFLSLLVKLVNEKSFEGIKDKVLFKIQEYIFIPICSLRSAIPLTRLYVALCRLYGNINRMRMFCCEAFFYTKDLAIPIFFAVLTSWIEVMPLETDVKSYPIAKVWFQLIHLKTCKGKGYNLFALKCLLWQYHGYPKEKLDCDELFKELCNEYLSNPGMASDYAIQLFCKNKDTKWIYSKINQFFIPLIYKIPSENTNFKAATIVLMGKVCGYFNPKCLPDKDYLIEFNRFFSNLLQDETIELIKQSIKYSIKQLPMKGKKIGNT